MNIYYVYSYADPTTNEIFYIGKGKNNRKFDHLKEAKTTKNSHKLNKIRSILSNNLMPVINVIQDCLSNEEAIALEKELIKKYGRRDIGTGILTNGTDGGDGVIGGSQFFKDSVSKRKAGKVTAKNLITGEFIECTKEVFDIDANLVGVRHGIENIHAPKGLVTAKTETGEIISVSKEEFDSNKNLVGINSGKSGLASHLNSKTCKCEKCGEMHTPSSYKQFHGEKCGKYKFSEERLKAMSIAQKSLPKMHCKCCSRDISQTNWIRHLNSKKHLDMAVE